MSPIFPSPCSGLQWLWYIYLRLHPLFKHVIKKQHALHTNGWAKFLRKRATVWIRRPRLLVWSAGTANRSLFFFLFTWQQTWCWKYYQGSRIPLNVLFETIGTRNGRTRLKLKASYIRWDHSQMQRIKTGFLIDCCWHAQSHSIKTRTADCWLKSIPITWARALEMYSQGRDCNQLWAIKLASGR